MKSGRAEHTSSCGDATGNPPCGASGLVRALLPQRHGDGILRDTVWNAAMNVFGAAMSVLVLVLVARLCGAYWCGVAGIALAMSQQLFTLGNFTVQGYQASDIAEKRSFGEYASAKTVSLGLMLAAAAAWIALDPPGRDKTLCLIPLLLYQASDAFGNVFFARYQQKGRLDTACRVRVAKIAAFMAVFAAALATIRSAPVALAAASTVHFALFFVLDRPLLRTFGPVGRIRPSKAAFSILLACAPIAFNSFLVMAVNNVPRFAVDGVLGEEAVAAYGAVFMVSFTVSICADFIMNPQIVPLAEAIRAADPRAALRSLRAPLLSIAFLGAAGLSVGATFGIPLLAWVFGLDLDGLRSTLCIVLGGGVLVALYQLAQTVLIVLRKQGWGMVGMVVSVLFVLLVAKSAVVRAGLDGAAWNYTAATALLLLCTAGFALVFGIRTFRTHSAAEDRS